MKVKPLSIFLLIFMPVFSHGWEIIVCVPLQLSYQQSIGELTLIAEAEEEIPGGLTGYICNISRSVCKPVHLMVNVASTLEISKEEVSTSMTFFQTEHNSQNNYGGCKWPVKVQS